MAEDNISGAGREKDGKGKKGMHVCIYGGEGDEKDEGETSLGHVRPSLVKRGKKREKMKE